MSTAKRADVGGQLEALAERVTQDIRPSESAIVLTVTDTGERFTVTGLGRRPRISRGDEGLAAGVHVTGTAEVINSVLSGKTEASAAFAHGGIRVRGDLSHLEAVLKNLGLLQCE